INLGVEPNQIILSGPTTYRSGTCQSYTVTTKDATNTVANMLAALTVNLSDGAGSGAFYSDNVCGTGITSTSVGVGSSSSTVYFKDNTAETITLMAVDAGGLLSTGSLSVTVGPDHISIAGNANVNSGSCQTYTITTRDTAGTQKAVAALLTIDLT